MVGSVWCGNQQFDHIQKKIESTIKAQLHEIYFSFSKKKKITNQTNQHNTNNKK